MACINIKTIMYITSIYNEYFLIDIEAFKNSNHFIAPTTSSDKAYNLNYYTA